MRSETGPFYASPYRTKSRRTYFLTGTLMQFYKVLCFYTSCDGSAALLKAFWVMAS